MLKIAIASGKGGTGKTFISTNLFNVLSKHSHQVILVDCDAEAPNDKEFIVGEAIDKVDVTQQVPAIDENKCTYCGKCFDYCRYHAIFFLEDARVIKVMDELCHGCGACTYACQYGAITEKDDVLGTVSRYKVADNAIFIEARMKVGVHSSVPVLKAAIKQAVNTDIVLMDAPPGTSCPFIQTANLADYVVLVTEPTPFGLSDLKQSVETLKSIGKSYGVIINRAGLGNNAIYDYLKEESIPLLMSIPFDRNIASIYSTGKLLSNESMDWELQFTELFNLILAQNGNSSH